MPWRAWDMIAGMWRSIMIYAVVLAVCVFLLEWLQYRFWARSIGIELLIGLVGLGCVALGIWVGVRLTRRADPAPFARNEAAIKSLSLTPRELDVLEALVSGSSNKALARVLGVSPNTVKTHLARLFGKLDVNNRVQAIEEARTLRLIPAAGDPAVSPAERTMADG